MDKHNSLQHSKEMNNSVRHCYLQSTVDHGVGASPCVNRLLFLQLDRMFGIKSEEVNELCGSVDLCLDHRLPLTHKQKTRTLGV